eukprot:TRINITY_DN298_c0_g1_i6.p1 TRINITY_DN298_c0_g1~~TRINITY_DN298_c0_g1_i6.p1  ORF type:complete len:363 (+),score=80.65 TRINITY_DN298_c0_g1_i6:904-1992(+)
MLLSLPVPNAPMGVKLDIQAADGIPAIVRLRDAFSWSLQHCMIFDLASCSLLDQIKKSGGLSFFDTLATGKQIAEAVGFMTGVDMVHCDLKPENILLYPDQFGNPTRVRLADFGSSCLTSRVSRSYIQSRYYRAPEILLELDFNKRIDVWSFGCILVEMVTGKPLFPGISTLDQLCNIQDCLGAPPDEYIQDSPVWSKVYFNDSGRFRLKKASSTLPPGVIEFPSLQCADGSVWLIKDSKSKPGSFYYVNTVTGASQWERTAMRSLEHVLNLSASDKALYEKAPEPIAGSVPLEDKNSGLVRAYIHSLASSCLVYDQYDRIGVEPLRNHALWKVYATSPASAGAALAPGPAGTDRERPKRKR